MSPKIICNVKPCGEHHELMIDETDVTRQNKCFYTRLTDFIPHGRKHSYHRIFWLIATVILIFFLGYFTRHLMSPVPETHDVTTKESTVISPINTAALNTDDTNTPVIFTSASTMKTIIPFTSTETVLKEPQIDLNICLKNITNRFEEIPGDTDNCIHRPIGKKSMITFLVNDTPLGACLLSDKKSCDQEYHAEKQNDIKIKYSHIFYNFIIGDYGSLYEGRPLSCRADESPVAWDYNNTRILIGKPLCSKLDSEKSWEKKRFNFALKNLLNCFETGGILSDSYKIEFSKNCKHYLDEVFLENYEKRIVFYDGGN